MKKPFLLRSTSLACALIVSGCASVSRQPSGFLSGYDRLEPMDTENKARIRSYVDISRLCTGRYFAVYLEPVVLETTPANSSLSHDQSHALMTDASHALRQAFEAHFICLAEPQLDCLRIRVSISDVNTSQPVLNAVTMAIAFVPFDLGAIVVEAEALDAVSGEQLFARIQSHAGTPIDVFSSLRKTGHASKGFALIARKFANDLYTAIQSPNREAGLR